MKPSASSSFLMGLAVLVTSFFGGCSLDPVERNAIQALGGEDPAVPPGEFHRPGQPCLVCHSRTGPASDSPFAVAGTIFYGPFKPRPVEGAWVRLIDADGNRVCKRTNCNGNFIFLDKDFGDDKFQGRPGPTFPLLVSVQKVIDPAKDPLGKTPSMNGHIGREGSCSACHKPLPPNTQTTGSFESPGLVRLFENEADVDKLNLPTLPCPPAEPPQAIPCPEDVR